MMPPRRDEQGSVAAFVAVIAVALVMVAGMAYDGGQIVAAQATARDLAAGAARAGAQEVDMDRLRGTGDAVLDAGPRPPRRASSTRPATPARCGWRGRP